MGSNSPLFTPADPTTWLIDPSAYPSSMVITSMLKFGGEISLDEGDRVAAYVNGECRGVAPVSFVSALNAYRAPLFVYGAQAGETVEFLMYDASTDRVHLAAQQLSFQPNGIEGSFVEPFVFEAQSMSATYAQSSTYCAADANGTLGITMVSGLQPPYSYEWNTGAHTASLEGLTAGDYTVTITGANGLSFTDTVALENLEVEIPAPEVEWSADNPVCRGTDVVLYAQAPNQEASVRWETADGNLLQETPALMIEGIQAAYTAYAKTLYRGCESEPLEATVQVYQPDASFTVEPAEEVTTETEVEFSPAEATGAFAWDFGDGQSSSLVSPQHQYSLPGHYQAILSRTDLAGCTGQGLYDLWVDAATQVLELPEGELRLQATPNPFGQYIDIQLHLPYSGQYTLELLSISGQVLERQQQVWQAGEQTIRLLPDLADGTYLIRLESSKGHQLALPIVKQTPRP
jgi:PKD repeat protein